MSNTVRSGPAAAPGHPRRWWILAVVLAAECMDLLDATVVNVAAPAINRDLQTSSTALQWIVGGYSLAVAVGLITGGRLGDLFGRRRLFLVGAVAFTVASLLCGVAPTTGTLVAFRLVQGLAAALLLPQGLGIIREVFAPEQMAAAFGVFGPVIGLAAVLGPILGGGLVQWDLGGTGWRLVFLVNLPVGVGAAVGAWRLLPRATTQERQRLDLLGAVLSGVACFALVYPLIEGREKGWPAWTYVLIAGSLAVFALFGLQQRQRVRRGRDPLVLPSVFAHRGYTAGLFVMLLFFAGMGGVLLTMSVFLQAGQGFSPIHTGVVFIPMSLGMAAGAGLSGGYLGKRFGRLALQGGGVLALVGLVLVIAAVNRDGTAGALALAPGLAVAGLGMGVTVAPLFDVVLADVTDAETGSASGLLNALQQLSGALGVAVLGTVFFAAVGPHGYAGALQRSLWVQVGALVAMLLASPMLPRMPRAEQPEAVLPAGAAPARQPAATAEGVG